MDIINPVSLEKRLNNFKNVVVAKHLIAPAHPSYRTLYHRLILTRRAAEFLISALLVFGGQQFIIANNFFSPLWPAAGVALAALFLRGNFPLVGIFIGTLASYLLSHMPFSTSLMQSVLFVSYAYLIRTIALRMIGPVTPIVDNVVLWKFYGLITLLSSVHSYLLFVVLTKTFMPNLSLWYMGWLGEISGILCILPFCLILDPFVSQRYFHKPIQMWWILALAIILGHLIYFALPTEVPTLILSLVFLVILSLYAKFFGQIPTCFALLGVAIIYLSATRSHFHLFHAASSLLQDKIIFTVFTFSVMLSISLATSNRPKSK